MSRTRFKPILYKFEKDNHFVLKIGTNTTDEIPNVVFLRAKTMITPLTIKKSYQEDILLIKNEFITFAKKMLDNNIDYDKNYIFSVDIAEKSVRHNKTSHFHYDVFLKPLKDIKL